VNAQASKPRTLVGYLLTAVVAAIAGFSIYQATNLPPSGTPASGAFTAPETLVGTQRPEFSLPNLKGEPISISRWDGKIVLLNFWATWCPPCRKEMPGFVELQERYDKRGFQAVGIAIDRPEAVARFTKDLNAKYPQLIGREAALEVTSRYGNHLGALPYSVLLDREGTIQFVKAGELSKQALETKLLELL
jgi:peroxiredoxin